MDRKYFKTAVSIFCLLFASTSFASLNFNMPKSPKMPNVKAPSFKAPNIKGFKMPKSPKMPDLKGLSKATSYIPRIYLSGYAGSSYLGQADLLFPVLQRYDRNIFLYAQGRYSAVNRAWGNNPWEGGLGVGYREIFGHSWILGAYGLLDYNKTYSAKSVISFDPGLEFLTKNWDVRLNGYIPVMNTKWSVSGWADQFGDYRYVSYKGHSELDHWYTYNVETGMGADAEVGRKLFTVWGSVIKGYLSGYYFAMQSNDSLMGGGAKITIQPTSYLKFKLEDTYDNYAKNTVMAGFEVSLYDLFSDASTKANDLALRHKLYEPIERNFGQIGVGNSTPTTMYGDYFEHHTHHHDHGGGVEHNDIWFFNGSSSTNAAANDNPAQEDGTYEHPYSSNDFNNATLKDIAAYAKTKNYKTTYLYFNPGMYSADNGSSSPVEVLSNDVIVGKMGGLKGFKYDATGNSRPQFIGGLKLDSNTSINNIRLANFKGSKFVTGIELDNAQNITLNNVEVGGNDDVLGYQNGITLNSSSLNINDSNILGYSSNDNSAGIVAKNGGKLSLNNTNITGTSVKKDGYGLNVLPGTSGKVCIGDIVGVNTVNIIGKGVNGYGLYINNNFGLNSIGNISNVNFNGTSDGAYISGIADTNIGDITNSNFVGTNGDGLHIQSPTGIKIGNITNDQDKNSNFLGANYGLYLTGNTVSVGDIKHYAFTGTNHSGLDIGSETTTSISSITNSDFNGGIDGVYISANTADGNVSIGNITGNASNHSVMSGGNHGIYIIGNTITLKDVSNYDFTGTDKSAFDIHAAKTINIGNISASNITGGQYGLYLAGTDNNNDLPDITIGNIGDDTGNTSISFTGGLDGIHIYGDEVNIGTIEHINSYGGKGTSSGSGMYINSNTELNIAKIYYSYIEGGKYGADFRYNKMNLNGQSDVVGILDQLINHTKRSNTIIGKKNTVLLNGKGPS